MATFYSVNTTANLSGTTSSGGIAGAPQQTRSPMAGAKLQAMIDSYVGLGTETTGAVIEFWPQVPVTARITSLLVKWDALGAGGFISVGKIDPNNSSNTDNQHYVTSVDGSNAGFLYAIKNMGEQVGQDPLGDESTGNTAPGFGQLPIIFTLTVTGVTIPVSTNFVIIVEWVSGT